MTVEGVSLEVRTPSSHKNCFSFKKYGFFISSFRTLILVTLAINRNNNSQVYDLPTFTHDLTFESKKPLLLVGKRFYICSHGKRDRVQFDKT